MVNRASAGESGDVRIPIFAVVEACGRKRPGLAWSHGETQAPRQTLRASKLCAALACRGDCASADATSIFRFKIGMIPTIAGCSGVGIVMYLAGVIA